MMSVIACFRQLRNRSTLIYRRGRRKLLKVCATYELNLSSPGCYLRIQG